MVGDGKLEYVCDFKSFRSDYDFYKDKGLPRVYRITIPFPPIVGMRVRFNQWVYSIRHSLYIVGEDVFKVEARVRIVEEEEEEN